MTRLWRAATLVLTATALVVGPASAAFATNGDESGRDRPGDRVSDRVVDAPVAVVADEPTDSVTDRVVDPITDRVVDPITDRPSDRVSDGETDRVTDRVADRETDRPSDRVTDRETDRVRRPECDPDQASDRVDDCRDTADEIRPAVKRCIHYVQTHTDLVIRRHLRWWLHVCHRIAWSHTHPE